MLQRHMYIQFKIQHKCIKLSHDLWSRPTISFSRKNWFGVIQDLFSFSCKYKLLINKFLCWFNKWYYWYFIYLSFYCIRMLQLGEIKNARKIALESKDWSWMYLVCLKTKLRCKKGKEKKIFVLVKLFHKAIFLVSKMGSYVSQLSKLFVLWAFKRRSY